MSMASQISEGTISGFMCWQSQCRVPSCLHPLCQPLHMGSCTQVPPECWFVWGTWVHIPPWSPWRLSLRKVLLQSRCHQKPPWWKLHESAHDLQKGWILDELNLQYLKNWSEGEWKQTGELLTKWEHLFAHSDLDLQKTSLINHHINLTYRMPFKECYWLIQVGPA